MKPTTTDWNGIALAKLTNVLGEGPARKLMAEILTEMHATRLESASELRVFAQALLTRGGFAGAIGGMLKLHATMYGADDAS